MGKPTTVAAYLNALPAERRKSIEVLRQTIAKNIDKTFEEGIQYGMIGYYIPHSVYPDGYHVNPKEPLPFAQIASQKNHIGLYLFCVYQDDDLHEWFVDAWKKSGKKLDMGKACVRIKSADDAPLDVIGKLFKRVKARAYIKHYESLKS